MTRPTSRIVTTIYMYIYIYISAIKLRQDFNGLAIHRSIAYVTEYERLRYRHIWGSEDQAQANTSCSAGQARCEPQFYDMKTAMTWSISQQFTMCLRAVIFQKVGSLMKSVLIFRHWTCIGGTALDCAPGPTMFLTEIINMPCGMCFANFLHLQGAFRKLSLFSGQVSWIAGSLFQTVLGWLETGYSKRWEQHVQRQKDPAGKLELELEISALPLKATSCYLDLYICIHIYFKQIKIL